VELLLGGKEVSPHKPDNCDQTPLSNGARNGHEYVVKILLERDRVNPAKLDVYGGTRFSFAIDRGRAGVDVKHRARWARSNTAELGMAARGWQS